MRTSLLLLYLATGCFGDRSNDHSGGGGSSPTPDAGVRADAPPRPDAGCLGSCIVAFSFDPTFPFGAGTEYSVGVHMNGSGNLIIENSDSAVAEVVAVAVAGTSKSVRIRGKSAGTTTLLARDGATNEVLDTVTLTVEYVATVGLQYRSGPGLDGPVTSLAALQGARDSFAIVYRNAAGTPLNGTGGFVTTGGVTIDPQGPAFRASNLFGGAHARVAVSITGSGTLATTLAGDPRQFVWPIEVVAAPATISLVPMWLDTNSMLAPLPAAGVKAGTFVGVDIIGRTADGRVVAGVEAVWSAPPGLTPFLTSATAPQTEGVFVADAVGSYAISAVTNGGATYTQPIVVTP